MRDGNPLRSVRVLAELGLFRKILWGMETWFIIVWKILLEDFYRLERSYEGWKPGRRRNCNVGVEKFRKILWGMETSSSISSSSSSTKFRKILWGMETRASNPHSAVRCSSLERSYEGWKPDMSQSVCHPIAFLFRKILWGMETDLAVLHTVHLHKV